MIKIAIISHQKDNKVKQELFVHLKGLEKWYPIKITDLEDIPPGTEIVTCEKQLLASSDFAILLISPYFLYEKSDYMKNIGQPNDFYRNGMIQVIPVLGKSVMWEDLLPIFKISPFSLLPIFDGVNISDEVLTEIMLGIINLIKANPLESVILAPQSKRTLSANNKISLKLIPQAYIPRGLVHYSNINYTLNGLNKPKNKYLVDLIDAKKRIVLLGGAGSGKSTELLQLASTGTEQTYFPLSLKLNDYDPLTNTLKNKLDNFYADWKNIPAQLVLILLDGFDEIKPQHINEANNQITAFSKQQPDFRIIISCRSNFYSPDKLEGFAPFFLMNLNRENVIKYYSQKYAVADAKLFWEEIYRNNLLKLIERPFFLMVLAEIFHQERSLEKGSAKLIELYINERIKQDGKYKNFRSYSQQIHLLLKEVAISMEMLARNYINEQELGFIIGQKGLDQLAHCAVFKQNKADKNIWQFEHNNIQEYFAASLLSRLPFERVLQLISFPPHFKKLRPNWLNTLTFLFSILEQTDVLYPKLKSWLIANEKHILIRFEKEKLAENFVFDLFSSIFDEQKKFDQWINYQNLQDLAKFGQSQEGITFLLAELSRKENSNTIKYNAISLLGNINFQNFPLIKEKVQKALFNVIALQQENELIDNSIYAITNAKLYNHETVAQIIQILGDNDNQNIRSSIYHLLVESELINQHVDYVVKGFTFNRDYYDKLGINALINLDIWFESCLVRVATANGLKKIISILKEIKYGDLSYKIIEAVITNAAAVSKEDPAITLLIKEWFLAKGHDSHTTKLLANFFELTKTAKNLFYEIWANNLWLKDSRLVKSLVHLTNQAILEDVVKKYEDREINTSQLMEFYTRLRFFSKTKYSEFKALVENKTNHEIIEPDNIDHAQLIKTHRREDFDRLFHYEQFCKNVTDELALIDKEEFTLEDYSEVKEKSRIYSHRNVRNVIIDFRRSSPNKTISKTKINNWLENEATIEKYCIQQIYHELKSNKDLALSSKQESYLIEFCKANIEQFSFNADGSYFMTSLILFFLTLTFKIKHEDRLLLKLLSSPCIFGYEEFCTISNLLEPAVLEKNVVTYLAVGISSESVYNLYATYAIKNRLTDGFPALIATISNPKNGDYLRKQILELFHAEIKDISVLKGLMQKADNKIRWSLFRLLKAAGETEFIRPFLLEILHHDSDEKERFWAASSLVEISDTEGIKYLAHKIKHDLIPKDKNHNFDLRCLSKLVSKAAIPVLIDLLEHSYQAKKDKLTALLISSFGNIAYQNQENFIAVFDSLTSFLEKFYTRYENVKQLKRSIDDIELNYYNKTQAPYSIEDVKAYITVTSTSVDDLSY